MNVTKAKAPTFSWPICARYRDNDLAAALSKAPRDGPVLIDCLTLWLSNRLLAEADLDGEIGGLDTALDRRGGMTVLVGNEVGLGIVPDNAVARRFRDAQGRLNQRLAARADRVALVVAGLPLMLKQPLREPS